MFNVQGCLGVTVGTANSTDEAIALVKKQIPVGIKKTKSLRSALNKLATGARHHIEYGLSGCTIMRM